MRSLASLAEFFQRMNDISFQYVVLRNWGSLPDDIQLGNHSDLDLLVYDFGHWKELFPSAKQVYPDPRVQFKVPINDQFAQVDVRYVGDGYYPKEFESTILTRRIYHDDRNIFTPNSTDYVLALAYHVVHHKHGENNYGNAFGNASLKELETALRESKVGWVKPTDPTVGASKSYITKGATSNIEKEDDYVIKRQKSFMEHDLMENEYRILQILHKAECVHFPHFPRVNKLKDGSLRIEDCGDELTVDNLPFNWKEQLVEIVRILKKTNIQHRDIQPNNLMVKEGIIKLIDFGWARLYGEQNEAPAYLGHPYKPSSGWDDNFSMIKVIRELEYKLEGTKITV